MFFLVKINIYYLKVFPSLPPLSYQLDNNKKKLKENYIKYIVSKQMMISYEQQTKTQKKFSANNKKKTNLYKNAVKLREWKRSKLYKNLTWELTKNKKKTELM